MRIEENIPRTDVGGGGLAGLLAAILMMVFNGEAYNFYTVAGFLGATLVFLAGYVPPEHKNFAMSITALLAPLLASIIGKVFFGVQWDNALVSTAVASLTVAVVAYLAPPNAQSEVIDPDRYVNRRTQRNPPPRRTGRIT